MPAHLLLEHIEIIDDDADEEVECEEAAAHDEHHEVDVGVEVGLPLGLHSLPARVHRVLHHFHPALERRLAAAVGQVGSDPDTRQAIQGEPSKSSHLESQTFVKSSFVVC